MCSTFEYNISESANYLLAARLDFLSVDKEKRGVIIQCDKGHSYYRLIVTASQVSAKAVSPFVCAMPLTICFLYSLDVKAQ